MHSSASKLSYSGFFKQEDQGPSIVLTRELNSPNVVLNHKLWTPLHVAVHDQDEESVRKLLLAGADGSALTHKLRSPLHMSAVRDNVQIFRLLLLSGTCNVSSPDVDGLTVSALLHKRAESPEIESNGRVARRMLGLLKFLSVDRA